ncbi:MFS transporter [Massilia sp. GCM10020059]|uniref:MFS transporter n=1 Tax=Massilia agrisoli TaxID=2892444 RepID=A0ABS8IUU4_9BURK|nr:MFS transporter [Massilia agrisoli]MCC6072329.1 MFS transporter [Massilia agrisoli]
MPKSSLSSPLPAQSARTRVPLSKPLRHPRYRRLWMANLGSNLGTWTQTFASAWLIASMSKSATVTTLVQTATYVPIFLFALFAGVIADAVDRPKFLFFCNLYMALCACAMAVLVMTGNASAPPVLALTFALATGSAFVWPAWQASVSGLVEPDELEAAATLNNLSYSVASIVGPALGGILFNWIGAGALFLVNAISFVGLLGVYWAWWQERLPNTAARHGFSHSMKTGLSTAFGCGRYRRILVNVCTVFFASIAFAALLPLFVRDVLRLDSSTFGTLMGSLGAGAVLAAFLLPSLRVRFDKTTLLSGALLVYGLMLMLMPLITSLWLLVPLIVCGGMAWSAIVSTMNAAAQSSFPHSLRARTLSIYLFVMAGGYALGSLVWGRVADGAGVKVAFAIAGVCMVINAIALATRKHDHPI